ncbi:MAG TPA: DUF6569 family protein [Rhodothermales bacterium]|nr:DUF6569 family protein [Rhodothermales bacterium]
MHPNIQTTLARLEQLPLQSNGSITIIPLSDPMDRRLTYLTLAEALRTGRFHITEVSHAGSVPALKAVNDTKDDVLLIDGEEVAGAKQNRVFNASILVPAGSTISIPVSCTEQGRWHYASSDFKESGHLMSQRQRMDQKWQVMQTLRSHKSYAGSQGAVWDEVSRLHDELGTQSNTGAMSDAFRIRGSDIDDLTHAFEPVKGQVGLAAVVNGRLLGLDYLSQESVFKQVFPKLIKSYTIEAMRTRGGSPSRHDRDVVAQYDRLVETAIEASESVHESVGLGFDYRYSSDDVVGSALVHKEEVVHMAFFAVDRFPSDEPRGRFSSFRERRDFRY